LVVVVVAGREVLSEVASRRGVVLVVVLDCSARIVTKSPPIRQIGMVARTHRQHFRILQP
jgi:hypothetical protein